MTRRLVGEGVPAAIAGFALVAGLAQALAAARPFATVARDGGPTPTVGRPFATVARDGGPTSTEARPFANASDLARSSVASSPTAASPLAVAPVAAPCSAIALPFAVGVATLDPAGEARARGLARWAVAHPEATFVLDGHADTRGDEIANLRLSKLRSTNVAAIFQALKVDSHRLTVRGFGTFVPAGGSAEDRRVTVTVLGGQCPDAEEVAP